MSAIILSLTFLWQATPFKHEFNDRVSFAVKLTAFVVTGAAIPFVAAYYQLYVNFVYDSSTYSSASH